MSVLEPDGTVHERVVRPEDFGISSFPATALAGGDATENARAITDMLGGIAHPALEAIVLNAAAALVVLRGGDLRDAARETRDAIASGRAERTLATWRDVARSKR